MQVPRETRNFWYFRFPLSPDVFLHSSSIPPGQYLDYRENKSNRYPRDLLPSGPVIK